jgi:sugar phosphate isomerase/epimerase
MKFGLSISPAKPLVQEIEKAGKWQPECIEIYIEPPLNVPQLLTKKAPLIKKVLAQYNILAISHANFACDLSSPDITIRASWLVELKREIAAAAKLGCQRIDVHANLTSYLGSVQKALEMDNLIASFALLAEEAKSRGMIIGVENTHEDPADIAHLLAKVKGLHATVDIGHAFMQGGMSAVKGFLELKEVDHIHVLDAKDGIDHLPLGEGKINFKQVVQILKKRNYSGTAITEIIASDAQRKESFEKFKEMMK